MDNLSFPKLKLIKGHDNDKDKLAYHIDEIEKVLFTYSETEFIGDFERCHAHLRILAFLLNDFVSVQ